jgi:hypothetical protein
LTIRGIARPGLTGNAVTPTRVQEHSLRADVCPSLNTNTGRNAMKARLFGTIALLMLPTIAFAADAGSGPTKGATSTNDAGSGPTPGAKPGTGSADSTGASSGQATKSEAQDAKPKATDAEGKKIAP